MNSDNTATAGLHRAAQRAVQAGDFRKAHQYCLEILKADPTFADAWFLCAVIAAHNGQVQKATEILERALLLAPDNPEYQAEMGKHLVSLHQHSKALEHANRALSAKPQAIPTLNTLGTVFSRVGEHGPALDCFEKAVQQLKAKEKKTTLPTEFQAELFFNLATSMQFAGRFEGADTAYETAIALQPFLFKAHSGQSSNRKQSADCNHLERLESLRTAVKTPRDRLHLGHAIAKEREDLGQYEAALEALLFAKDSQAALAGYSFADDAAQFAALQDIFTAARRRDANSGHTSPEPIFIVGMPRTGTTLVEQIVSSHSSVMAAGELQNFPLAVKRMTQTPSPDVLDLETLQASRNLDMAKLGEAYINSTRPQTGSTPRFIDKLPLNFMYIGLILEALPNAKIICLRRDPMDTCLSNFRQLFAVDFKHYHYNYDLLTCGQYFIEFDKLMRHWHSVNPGKIFDVQYEGLVAEPDVVSKALLDHCELAWEPQCLDFHKRQTSVATPSAVQVRQGIYSTSVNRWQRYGKALQPLLNLLRSAGYYPDTLGSGRPQSDR